MKAQLATLIPGVQKRNRSSLTIVEEQFFDLSIDFHRRHILNLFVEGVEKTPSKYSIAITMDDFYINMIRYLKDQNLVLSAHWFREFWGTSGNRQLIIREIKYVVGEKLFKGQLFLSLPLQISNTCINAYRHTLKNS